MMDHLMALQAYQSIGLVEHCPRHNPVALCLKPHDLPCLMLHLQSSCNRQPFGPENVISCHMPVCMGRLVQDEGSLVDQNAGPQGSRIER